MVVKQSDEGGRRAGNFGTHLAQMGIADFAGVRRAFLHQLAEERLRARSRTAAERRTSECLVVVEVSVQDRAGRAHTANRCATWVNRSCPSPRGAAAWSVGASGTSGFFRMEFVLYLRQ